MTDSNAAQWGASAPIGAGDVTWDQSARLKVADLEREIGLLHEDAKMKQAERDKLWQDYLDLKCERERLSNDRLYLMRALRALVEMVE